MDTRDCEYILGIPVDNKPLKIAICEALNAIQSKGDTNTKQEFFACANPHSIVIAQQDNVFKNALNEASTVVADGTGVTIMSKLSGIQIGPRITGNDYFINLMSTLNDNGSGRVFFFGSSQHVLNLIREKLEKEFPNLTFCGCISPPYREWSELENNQMIDSINQARPDLLWVGMTAPKQEKWIAENRQTLQVPVVGAIGAVFDFYAGTYSRAPRFVCRLGFEWLFRLMKEPRRMWRRNFISTPAFVYMVLRDHVFLRQT